MEKDILELYETAKNAIDKMMRKVIKEDPELTDEEDIRVQTELLLTLKLTDKVKHAATLPDEVEKAIQYTMRVFNKAFHEVYDLYLQELQEKNIESTITKEDVEKTKQNLGEER